MWQKLITWLETHSLTCQFYQNYHIECPGCGLQSAFILLLNGRFIESIHTYPALLPLIFLILSFSIHIKFRSSWTRKSNRILGSLALLLILGNFFVKQL
ncbi:DUF2752 domain-containing protein [Ancylomarina salipaludis]|uniref:DUF2752 domain-containing protein n=1 Tax=Ancylomarina salipaludis TaxID=2501299 RepID=A0A4Q1JQB3_9BACT|nr:DUF2752 domain-containing protein [Ancylomarina salipaludis]